MGNACNMCRQPPAVDNTGEQGDEQKLSTSETSATLEGVSTNKDKDTPNVTQTSRAVAVTEEPEAAQPSKGEPPAQIVDEKQPVDPAPKPDALAAGTGEGPESTAEMGESEPAGAPEATATAEVEQEEITKPEEAPSPAEVAKPAPPPPPPLRSAPPPPQRNQSPPPRQQNATTTGSHDMFGMGKTAAVAMPPPKAVQKSPEEPLVDTKEPRGLGGYLTFEWTQQGACQAEWRKNQVENALLYAMPKSDEELAELGLKPVPEHRYKGKKEQLSRNMQGEPNSFYRGVCAFVKSAFPHGCGIEMLPTGRPHSPKDLRLFIHRADQAVTIVNWGEEFECTAIDAVAAGPSTSKGFKETMTLNEFVTWGSSIGGGVQLG